VSCTSNTACTAVGSYTNGEPDELPLAERWNGTRWSIQRAATPPGTDNIIFGPGTANIILTDVSCPSKTVCVASGSYTVNSGNYLPFVERWNGRR
jgi:hypothetical protein